MGKVRILSDSVDLRLDQTPEVQLDLDLQPDLDLLDPQKVIESPLKV